jgi:type VI protein secretion system component VasF
MMHIVSQRLQAYFGWCPNHPGAHVQAVNLETTQAVPKNVDPEPPQPGTIPTRIATPTWMNAATLVILFATCFVGGNIWWPFFVVAVLIACLAYWYYNHRKEAQ